MESGKKLLDISTYSYDDMLILLLIYIDVTEDSRRSDHQNKFVQ